MRNGGFDSGITVSGEKKPKRPCRFFFLNNSRGDSGASGSNSRVNPQAQ